MNSPFTRALIPDIITASRGLGALAMLFAGFRSPVFWAVYLWCGISDMIDGPIARRMNSESRTGALLDSIADLSFVVNASIVFLPQLDIPTWMWTCIGVIALVRISSIVSGFMMHGKVILLHTIANKVTGLLLFLFPISLEWIPFNYAAVPVIAVALLASIQEGHLIRTQGVKDNQKME